MAQRVLYLVDLPSDVKEEAVRVFCRRVCDPVSIVIRRCEESQTAAARVEFPTTSDAEMAGNTLSGMTCSGEVVEFSVEPHPLFLQPSPSPSPPSAATEKNEENEGAAKVETETKEREGEDVEMKDQTDEGSRHEGHALASHSAPPPALESSDSTAEGQGQTHEESGKDESAAGAPEESDKDTGAPAVSGTDAASPAANEDRVPAVASGAPLLASTSIPITPSLPFGMTGGPTPVLPANAAAAALSAGAGTGAVGGLGVLPSLTAANVNANVTQTLQAIQAIQNLGRLETSTQKEGETLEEQVARTVHVGNVDAQTTEQELRAIFSAVGTITALKIAGQADKSTKFAFIEFENQQLALTAHALSGAVPLHGRTIKVNHAKGTVFPRSTASPAANAQQQQLLSVLQAQLQSQLQQQVLLLQQQQRQQQLQAQSMMQMQNLQVQQAAAASPGAGQAAASSSSVQQSPTTDVQMKDAPVENGKESGESGTRDKAGEKDRSPPADDKRRQKRGDRTRRDVSPSSSPSVSSRGRSVSSRSRSRSRSRGRRAPLGRSESRSWSRSPPRRGRRDDRDDSRSPPPPSRRRARSPTPPPRRRRRSPTPPRYRDRRRRTPSPAYRRRRRSPSPLYRRDYRDNWGGRRDGWERERDRRDRRDRSLGRRERDWGGRGDRRGEDRERERGSPLRPDRPRGRLSPPSAEKDRRSPTARREDRKRGRGGEEGDERTVSNRRSQSPSRAPSSPALKSEGGPVRTENEKGASKSSGGQEEEEMPPVAGDQRDNTNTNEEME
uniref:RRM domain-containing protein n=1 Tax=Chromera velia CCMP2878 TaxID=1169474 RepID=A0A0G4FE40_9ALVE|eukprot:Cvel_3247.t1-p1 / transcript=Cvel_3247.t1 / gene=Cvel_3247 / organism=Chromera_velia_CCMP2878 / gene_product=Splicing regulatory glutamine/lysine-rich protein 1, putative / transcript_product=Splicing regulatory glutamine/lysine-rich protein 1, putative / location=Cvel_scaffold127:75767-80059(+) / protein_length=783 / sequence_SO=supercontig / SO=protein_coding / is_pseudo=false